ncbi:MAG: hypothetical protein DRQ02_03000 [Candidatus Latescibacterota bacterium]|nr:MAG: hypothetical protein DRQ02_03000 [Candidatus Latescibacterota bacterium]
MPLLLVRAIQIIVVLLLLLLIYLWIPEDGIQSRKRRKRALSRMNESMYTGNSVPPTLPRSSPVPGPNTEKLVQRSWSHKRIASFYAQYVTPYKKVLERGGYLHSIETLFELLDRYGDCPSVVKLDADREYQQIRNVYDLLAKVTLLEHSLNVAEQMVKNLGTNTKDPDMLMGKILVTSLGHDIGKIPELIETQKYAKGDHPYISYLVTKKVILKGESPQHEEILTAIREHHYPVREGFTYELRKADQQARELETEQLALKGEATTELVHLIQEQKLSHTEPVQLGSTSAKGNIPEVLDLSWLDLDEFLALVEEQVNISEDGIHFSAFSMSNGLIYVTLDLVSDTVLKLAKKHNHPEVLLNAETKEKKRAIEYTVKTMLVEKELIPSFIGEGYTGARFVICTTGKKRVGFYLPIHANAFQTPLAELEARKKDAFVISEITEVKPLIGKKN